MLSAPDDKGLDTREDPKEVVEPVEVRPTEISIGEAKAFYLVQLQRFLARTKKTGSGSFLTKFRTDQRSLRINWIAMEKGKKSKKESKSEKENTSKMVIKFHFPNIINQHFPFKKPHWKNPNCNLRGNVRFWPNLKQILAQEEVNTDQDNPTCIVSRIKSQF
jgi:hypothetical protein